MDDRGDMGSGVSMGDDGGMGGGVNMSRRVEKDLTVTRGKCLY